ncbi:hypothetical protein BS78_01G158600 [Paspalum vaginatum]|nr:hypothetical protein BS78_01G158600 [Paspalum vaginatum]
MSPISHIPAGLSPSPHASVVSGEQEGASSLRTGHALLPRTAVKEVLLPERQEDASSSKEGYLHALRTGQVLVRPSMRHAIEEPALLCAAPRAGSCFPSMRFRFVCSSFHSLAVLCSSFPSLARFGSERRSTALQRFSIDFFFDFSNPNSSMYSSPVVVCFVGHVDGF